MKTIKIVSPSVNVSDRLFFCNGAIKASDKPYTPYREGAIIPRYPMIKKTDELYSSRLDDTNCDCAASIIIFEVGRDIIDQINLLKISEIRSIEAALSIYKLPELPKIIENIRFLIKDSMLTDSSELNFLSLAINYPNLESITTVIDGSQTQGRKVFSGLHIDDIENNSILSAKYSMRRLAINIGSGARYLLFSDATVKEVALRVAPSIAEDAPLPADIVRQYYENNMDDQVYAIKLMPNEAYICFTENIIHDATNIDSSAADIVLHFIGNFSLSLSKINR